MQIVGSQSASNVMKMVELQPGQVATILSGTYDFKGCVVMRTQSSLQFEIMNLSRPEGGSWIDIKAAMEYTVELLPRGEEVVVRLKND